MGLRALSFDLWDTLILDDSDEPERARRGLPPKVEARAGLWLRAVRAEHPQLDEARAAQAWQSSQAAFREQWKIHHRTPGAAWRVARATEALGLPPLEQAPALVEALEAMELDPAPLPVPGIGEALEQLASRYRLGITSDAILTPGRHLRALLRRHGLLEFFQAFAFSDEVGRSKPHPAIFQHLAAQLEAPLPAIAHVGDREANDVEGPLALGMTAVLFTAAVDRGADRTRAHAVCARADQLPAILSRIGGSP